MTHRTELEFRVAQLEFRADVLEKIVEKQNLLIEALAKVSLADKQQFMETFQRVGSDIGQLQRAVFPQRN